jgi:hypothetical protein
VKDEVHVCVNPQNSVAVNVTVDVPPHVGGAGILLCDKVVPQPKIVFAEPIHKLYAAFACACVPHAANVKFAGQVSVEIGDSITLNVEVHVTGALQLSKSVNTTVLEPPQADGAPVLLFDTTGLHPPENAKEFNQLLYLWLITA